MLNDRTRRVLRYLVAGVALLFLLLQLIPVKRSNPAVAVALSAPPEVETILRRACFDCHSHETRWPWYSRIAPLSWWVVDHVTDGRGDLNFSDWPVFDFELQELALRDIAKQVSSGEMPLWSYTLLHPEARLDEEDREALLRWADVGR